MTCKKLTDFLDKMNVKYLTINHDLAYTSQQIAMLSHIRGKDLAKTVMVKSDGRMAMVVLPASYKVDLELVRQTARASLVVLANEFEFQDLFPECEAGAMPPFGNLYGMEVYVDEKLARDTEIAFNAGSHLELIKLAYKDWVRLVKPRSGKFTTGKVPAF